MENLMTFPPGGKHLGQYRRISGRRPDQGYDEQRAKDAIARAGGGSSRLKVSRKPPIPAKA